MQIFSWTKNFDPARSGWSGAPLPALQSVPPREWMEEGDDNGCVGVWRWAPSFATGRTLSEKFQEDILIVSEKFAIAKIFLGFSYTPANEKLPQWLSLLIVCQTQILIIPVVSDGLFQIS